MTIDEFFERVAGLRRDGASFAIATVVARRGPVSSGVGDRALVFADGRMEGFVGGSCSREIVRDQAVAAIGDGEPRMVSIRPDAESAGDAIVVEMSCGSQGAVDVYIEPFVRARTVVIVGLTPVADALARLAATLDYGVRRVVSRDEVRDLDDALALDELPAFLDDLSAEGLGNVAVVVASQGHYDETSLQAALRRPPAYVGLVASRKRAAEVLALVGAAGLATDDVRAPAGLALGARNPSEVALSILAEIVEQRPGPRTVATAGFTAAAPTVEAVTDPVCGMQVRLGPDTPSVEYEGVVYGFCCMGCATRFVEDPAAVLQRA